MNSFPATLHGSGPRTSPDWTSLTASLPTATAAWADLSGFHITHGLPTSPPITTHLWAWDTSRWLRVRIDHTHWWAALLHHDTTITDDLWTSTEHNHHVHAHTIEHWPPTAGEIAQRRIDPPDALTTLCRSKTHRCSSGGPVDSLTRPAE